MITIEFQEDTAALRSAFENHVMLLAECQRREPDEGLGKVIAAQLAVQQARMRLIDAHIKKDRAGLSASLDEVSEATSTFLREAFDWRRFPLPESVVVQLDHRNSLRDHLATYLQDEVAQCKARIEAGGKLTLVDIRRIEGVRVEGMHEISTLEYELALQIIDSRMFSPSALH